MVSFRAQNVCIECDGNSAKAAAKTADFPGLRNRLYGASQAGPPTLPDKAADILPIGKI
jgi:hypothetical protein